MSDGAFDRNLRTIGKTKGACPATERLASFLSGELKGEDATAITNHIASCGVCDALVERMRRFDDPEAWQDADRRLTERFDSFLQGKRRSASFLLRRPWFAYAVLLLLIYPAYRGLTPRPAVHKAAPPPDRPIGLESAKILQLGGVRSAGGSEIVLTERDRIFILSFFVPIGAGRSYSAAIVDSAGKVVVTQAEISSYDGKGNFYLVCERRPFQGGQYVLTVRESGASSGEFHFPFTL